MVACAIEAMAESAALVRAHGMSAEETLDAIITSLFNVPVYRGYGDMIGKRQYEPAGFDLVLGLKDVRLALMAGEEAKVPLPFASVLRDSFMDAIANGDAFKGLVGDRSRRGATGGARRLAHVPAKWTPVRR